LLTVTLISLMYNFSLIGMRGFEPPTPASRKQCATKLRYIPLILQRIKRIARSWKYDSSIFQGEAIARANAPLPPTSKKSYQLLTIN
jgi:hypothetical protein